MKFRIDRASSWRDKPCKEARQESVIRVDERTTDDPKKIPLSERESPNWWYESGKNHRVENGHIKRDFDDTAWVVDVNTLEELLKLRRKYGDLILHHHDDDLPGITIYDDYME